MRELVVELQVRNHPGVMSHVSGLFARRGYNIERILCLPEDGGGTSRILLAVGEAAPLEQVIRQARKLGDVLDARVRPESGAELFSRVAASIRG